MTGRGILSLMSATDQLTQNASVEHPRAGWCFGLDGKWRPNRRHDTTQRDALIIRLHEQGMSVRGIAPAAGCSAGTVHRVLKLAREAA